MVILTIVIALVANDKLNNFLAILGAVACIPIGYTLPALFHYRICAINKNEKYKDIILIAVSILLAVYSAINTIINW